MAKHHSTPKNMTKTKIQIALIIPFFQRQEGLLRRSVESAVSCMKNSEDIKLSIIVVDDASPISAEVELKNFKVNNNQISLKIINQPNKGPGGARNTGLNSLTDSTDIVAFLDSDDTWSQDHVQCLLNAFTAGADFYFADHQRTGEPLTRFQECDFEQSRLPHPESTAIEYDGDIFYEILKKSPVGTPTVAYRFDKYKFIRFDEDIRVGEDSMLWLDITDRNPRTFYSPNIAARCGRGVNIFHGVQWGTTADLIKLCDAAKFHKSVTIRYTLDGECFALNKKYLAGIDKSFTKSMLGAIKHGENSVLSIAWRYFRLRPQFLFSAPKAILELINRP